MMDWSDIGCHPLCTRYDEHSSKDCVIDLTLATPEEELSAARKQYVDRINFLKKAN